MSWQKMTHEDTKTGKSSMMVGFNGKKERKPGRINVDKYCSSKWGGEMTDSINVASSPQHLPQGNLRKIGNYIENQASLPYW